ncbi:hypothetical protein KCP73_18960 [Salmonella enterica subsp. enterica]|nr:hypothetical protein KCP73_18960 [Salmonella enterica subsp. enterica]
MAVIAGGGRWRLPDFRADWRKGYCDAGRWADVWSTFAIKCFALVPLRP